MKGEKIGNLELSRLHCTVPKSLMLELREKRLLGDIDNIVSRLLSEYVEEKGREQQEEPCDE